MGVHHTLLCTSLATVLKIENSVLKVEFWYTIIWLKYVWNSVFKTEFSVFVFCVCHYSCLYFCVPAFSGTHCMYSSINIHNYQGWCPFPLSYHVYASYSLYSVASTFIVCLYCISWLTYLATTKYIFIWRQSWSMLTSQSMFLSDLNYKSVLEVGQVFMFCCVYVKQGGRKHFTNFWIFRQIFRRFTLNFANTSFQVLKAWNIVYKDMKTPNLPRCYLTLHLKWQYFQIQIWGLFITMPYENGMLFALNHWAEKPQENVNHLSLLGAKWRFRHRLLSSSKCMWGRVYWFWFGKCLNLKNMTSLGWVKPQN